MPAEPNRQDHVPLRIVAREWARIGITGFGGPPTHIRLRRDLCVDRRRWIDEEEFEHAVAACNLLPGPASTQLAIFCAWRVSGPIGAIVGGACFIVPGLIIILILAALFLAENPPTWLAGAAAGAGAAVAAVAVHAGWGLTPPSWTRRTSTFRWLAYAAIAAISAGTIGPWVVLVLLGSGLVELIAQGLTPRATDRAPALVLTPISAGVSVGVLASLSWVALKVGALSYGGGFVIIPLMQADAVNRYHWMTSGQFLTAVALGQVTPGPVVQTVAVVGFAAAGVFGGILAAIVAFTPSFIFILGGARHFDRLRANQRARAFLAGSGPAAIGAILGSAIPLTLALHHPWQYAVLAAAALALLILRRGVVITLLAAAVIGAGLALLGAPTG